MGEEFEDVQWLYAACDGDLAKLKAIGDTYTLGEVIRWMQKERYRGYIEDTLFKARTKQ